MAPYNFDKDSLYEGIAQKIARPLTGPVLLICYILRSSVDKEKKVPSSHSGRTKTSLWIWGRLSLDQMTDELHSSEITRIIATFWFAHVHMVHVNRKEFSNSWI